MHHLAIPSQESESLWGLKAMRGQDWENFTLAAQCGLGMRINVGSFQSLPTCSASLGYRSLRSPLNSFQLCSAHAKFARILRAYFVSLFSGLHPRFMHVLSWQPHDPVSRAAWYGVCEVARHATMHPLHGVCMKRQKKQGARSLSSEWQLFEGLLQWRQAI